MLASFYAKIISTQNLSDKIRLLEETGIVSRETKRGTAAAQRDGQSGDGERQRNVDSNRDGSSTAAAQQQTESPKSSREILLFTPPPFD
jgi:hypothetical protein